MRLHSLWFRPGINADVLRSIRRGRVGNPGDRQDRPTGSSLRGRWGPGEFPTDLSAIARSAAGRAPETELETWADTVLDAGTLDEVFRTTT